MRLLSPGESVKVAGLTAIQSAQLLGASSAGIGSPPSAILIPETLTTQSWSLPAVLPTTRKIVFTLPGKTVISSRISGDTEIWPSATAHIDKTTAIRAIRAAAKPRERQ
jgi:hypothetical protein